MNLSIKPKSTQNKASIAVAMSGGVDSSVAAYLLLEQGFQVFGVTMQLWNEVPERTRETIQSAREICSFLNIPFHVLDLREKFRQIVIEYYLQSQLHGLTPNPCFRCNQNVKWGILLDEAMKLGADHLATGHYARIVKHENGHVDLYKGLDAKKDQSYVLAGLTQAQLSRAVLPLGEMTKSQVREIAHRYSFPLISQSESQDLCFLGGVDQEAFFAKYLKEDIIPGRIVSIEGETIGEHNGLSNYTIGQRKGLGSGNAEPVYVINKDTESNTIIVGTRQQLGSKRVGLTNLNWINGRTPDLPLNCALKIRYTATPVCGTINLDENHNLVVVFDQKVRDATPGQFIVFYDDDKVLGSAEISHIYREEK